MENLVEFGYLGLFIACFLAATIIPLSSEVVFIGLLVAGANPIVATIIATVGNTLGGMTGYLLGYLGKWEWLEKYFRVKEENLEKCSKMVNRYGSSMAFFSWLPFIGDFIPIVLGLMRTSRYKVLLFMTIGKLTRYTLWAYITINGIKLFS
jgi:membrane protein YqaA with SNARE-associated domain